MAARSRSPPLCFLSRQDFLSRAINQRGCVYGEALFDWWKLLNDDTPKVLHMGDTLCQDPLAKQADPPNVVYGQTSIFDYFWKKEEAESSE